MADSFNPYLTWLNIKTAASPPDHYALLGIAPFESDQQVVSTAAGAQLAKVRGIRPGSRLTEWQRVIDELTSAKNCLCDPTTKAAYDKTLRQRLARGDSSSSANADSAIKSAAPKSDRSKREGDAKAADPGRSGRNILPPSQSDLGKQRAGGGSGAESPASAINPLPPTKSAKAELSQAPSSGSRISVVAGATSPQAHTIPAMRLPLPSAIPATAMPIATGSAAAGPKGAAPFAPAGVPIQPLPMPGAALPQQPVVPGLRPSVPLPTPTASGAATGTAAILLADSAATATRQSADQPSRPSPALSSLEQLGIGGQPEFRRTTGPQRRSSTVPLIAVGIAVAAAVTVGLIIANKTRVGADLIAGGGGGSSTSSSKDGAGQTSAASAATSSTATTAADKSPDPPKLRQDSSRTQNNQKPTVPAATDSPTRASSPKDPHPAPMPEPRPSRPFNPLLDQAPFDVEPPKHGLANVEPTKVEPTEAMPNPVKHLPEGPVDPAQAAKLSQTLAEARTKLSQRQAAEARKLIETAAQLATTKEQHDMVERMDSLEKYVDGFWSAVRDAMKGLKPTDEIDINSATKVIVVQATADALTIHIGSANKTFQVDQLPSGLAVALALRWFDPNKADNKVYIGAFHLVDPKTGPAYAKKDWNEAAAAGVDVSNLLPLLKPDESLPPEAPIVNAPKPGAIKPAERKTASPKPSPEQPITANPNKVQPAATAAPLSKVPSNDLIDKVEKQLQADLGSEFADAATPQKKAELAKKLIEQAASDHDPVRRFVMWRDARDLAAEAGQPAVMIQAVDQMAAQFRIDPLDMKADALAASPPKDGTTGRAYGEAALKLADEALAAGRQALAGRYSQLALAAARAANSVELIRKAQKKAKEIQDAAKTDSGM